MRLFLALWPTAQARAALASWRDAWPRPASRARPVADERLHLTLHFIGDVEAARAAGLPQRLAVGFDPFEITLDDAQDWPGPGVAVLAAHRLPDGLRSLHGRLGDALKALGLLVDTRAFRPHVTLWRWPGGLARPDEPRSGLATPPAPVTWGVRSYALVESLPGAGYRPVALFDADGTLREPIKAADATAPAPRQ